MSGSRRGFSLVELVVAIVLAVMIMAGLASIFATTYRFHTETQQKDEVRGETVLALRAVTRDIEGASWIQTPSPPCGNNLSCSASAQQTSPQLFGCRDWDPIAGGAPPPINGPTRAFWFCVAAQELWYYWKTAGVTSAICANGPISVGVACGAAPGGGWANERIATGVGGAGFTRPSNTNNMVQIQLVMTRAPIPGSANRSVTSTIDTAITMASGAGSR